MESKDSEKGDILTEYYDPVAIVLSSINYNTENLTDELRKCAITYDQLSGLVEEDLRLMGMTNSKAIKEILAEISQLSNQQRLYDSVLRNEFDPEEYVRTVAKNSGKQLQSMKLVLDLLHLKLLVSFPHNVLLEDRIYASHWCLRLCEKIDDKLDEIECLVKGEKKRRRTKMSVQKIGVSILLLSGAIALAVCFTNRGPRLAV